MSERLKRFVSAELRQMLGECPLCSVHKDLEEEAGNELLPTTVIYRRSPSAITMRCNKCGLQWAMTWQKIRQAALWHRKKWTKQRAKAKANPKRGDDLLEELTAAGFDRLSKIAVMDLEGAAQVSRAMEKSLRKRRGSKR